MRITNIDYLGYQMSVDNKDKVEALNKSNDISDDKIPKPLYYKDIEKSITADNIPKTIKLNQIMTHNVLQNIPTQEIMKIIGIK